MCPSTGLKPVFFIDNRGQSRLLGGRRTLVGRIGSAPARTREL